jgi:hypothetical protein
MGFCRSPIAMVFLSAALLAPLAPLAGCEIIAGIDDKTLAGVGASADGAGAAGGSAGAAGGGAGGWVVGDPLCAPGSIDTTSCAQSVCDNVTDSKSSSCHCGSCNHSCGGKLCVAGYCQATIMTSGLPFVYRVATNGKAVYFASSDSNDTNGAIYALPLDASDISDPTPFALLKGYTEAIEVIAADCNNVYFAEKFKSSLFSIPLTGGMPSLISATEPSVVAIVADGTNVYWVSGSDGNQGAVRMWDPAAKVLRSIAQGQSSPFGLAVDNTHIYWSLNGPDLATNGIRRTTIPTTAAQPDVRIVTQGGQPSGIAVDDESVYWIEKKAPSSIMRAPKAGGMTSVEVATTTGPLGDSIAVDENYVYWIEDSGIRKRRKDLGEPAESVANSSVSGQYFMLYWLTIDRSRLYFANTSTSSDGAVMWVAK